MREPCGVLDVGEWSVWCRACSWRSKPKPLTDRQVFCAAEAEWAAHPCAPVDGAPAYRLEEVGPVPLASREVA
jgi:hypothetical protein